ncbi:MAG: squalene/phytoene synthase family protein [Pseudomonadota bacterium]
MTIPASPLPIQTWKQLDERIRRVDEARWLSSRYAPLPQRNGLIALYAFNYELARVRLVVSEPALGAIRFQWWRDALEDLATGQIRQHEVVEALNEAMQTGPLERRSLEGLIDGHEAAFEAEDRGLEPEAALMHTAASVLSPSPHGWHASIDTLAPAWAALRRRDAAYNNPAADASAPPAPSAIRPAIAHLRLRHAFARQLDAAASGPAKLSPFAMRLSILRAMLTGRV